MDALRIDWPRIPFPGDERVFKSSSDLGATLRMLLDAEIEVDGVTRGSLRAGLASLGLPNGSDYEVTVGWGSAQRKPNGTRLIMPGAGSVTERAWSEAEREALTQIGNRHNINLDSVLLLLGTKAVDVHVNGTAGWLAVPAKVWSYTLGGYPVLKKWLSYRESELIGRALRGGEMLHFAKTVRRIIEILCMGPALDAAYTHARESTMKLEGV